MTGVRYCLVHLRRMALTVAPECVGAVAGVLLKGGVELPPGEIRRQGHFRFQRLNLGDGLAAVGDDDLVPGGLTHVVPGAFVKLTDADALNLTGHTFFVTHVTQTGKKKATIPHKSCIFCLFLCLKMRLAPYLPVSMEKSRIVITGLGLTAPNGNTLAAYRQNLLDGVARIQNIDVRHMGMVHAGVCDFDPLKYQKRKEVRNGTRAGSVAIYCAREALDNCGVDFDGMDKSRVGVYLGITEHGNVETENEIHNIAHFENDTKYWTHHHNPRTVANNPAGEVTLNLGITGPHYTVGAACAAGNAGLIQAAQMLILGECDFAFAGGVSESIHTFGIFAGFKNQGALAVHDDPAKASRPFDKDRNGIVVSEGGCIYTVERLEDAQARGATIVAEIAGWCINSDATDAVLPNPERQAQCMQAALKRAGMAPGDIDIVSTHATATPQGDIQEVAAVREVFDGCPETYVNNTKSFIGHAMGAAGALELAGNLPAFQDGVIHPTINVDNLDPECGFPTLVINEPKAVGRVDSILNNSFGMLGINSALILKRYEDN